ncbi:hypothetical protein BDW68DRAFT_178117 [Aspergillus falconensis]
MPAKEDLSIFSYESRPPRSTRIVSAPQHRRRLSIPDKTDHEEYRHKHDHTNEPEAQPGSEHDENISQSTGVTKGLRIRRLTSRPHSLQFPRTQTSSTLSCRSIFTPSRLPTPTQPPKDARKTMGDANSWHHSKQNKTTINTDARPSLSVKQFIQGDKKAFGAAQ